MGHVFLWLHFIYDLVPLRYGLGILEPLDFSELLKWTQAHLFFSLTKKRDKGKLKQDEMHYKTHYTWIHWAMQKARWILSKVTHAFRGFGAQQLHDDGCSDNNIRSLGGWQQGEMWRSYVMGIPLKLVFLQAGFSGDRGDYYIGRARAKLPCHEDKDKDEWWQLLGLMRKHIFPRVEEDLKKVHTCNAAQIDTLKRHYAGPHMTPGACERKMRRMHLVMQAVETFRVDRSEAETGTTVALLDDVYLLCKFTEFTNGLAVLHETLPNKKQKSGTSIEKRTVNDQAQCRVSWLIVKMGLRDEEWGTALFGDGWGVIKKEELAKEKAKEEKKRAAAAKKAELEKAKAAPSKRSVEKWG
ncbi:unnamed protein product [Closterium sp. NIES-54]